MQEKHKAAKKQKRNKSYAQERRKSTNIRMESLDVSPQTQNQSNKVPTKELEADPLISPHLQKYENFVPSKYTTSNITESNSKIFNIFEKRFNQHSQ